MPVTFKDEQNPKSVYVDSSTRLLGREQFQDKANADFTERQPSQACGRLSRIGTPLPAEYRRPYSRRSYAESEVDKALSINVARGDQACCDTTTGILFNDCVV